MANNLRKETRHIILKRSNLCSGSVQKPTEHLSKKKNQFLGVNVFIYLLSDPVEADSASPVCMKIVKLASESEWLFFSS